MLTGKLVRVRYHRDRVIPGYIDAGDADWLDVAERLRSLFAEMRGRPRGELEEELRDAYGDSPAHLVHRGLAKLLEDRCEFEVVSGQPPDKLRETAFRLAAEHRRKQQEAAGPGRFDRGAVLALAGEELGLTAEQVGQGLFADLKSEQRLVGFKDVTAERLLQRYNVGLAQAVLLRSTQVEIEVRGEPPQRYRRLLGEAKFHRLVCEVERRGGDGYLFKLDGPMSLFSATVKYGLQLALFLPAVLACRDFELRAELRWGPQRRPKTFQLSNKEGLVSHVPDRGMYVPPELAMFAELFRSKAQGWDIAEQPDVLPLGGSFWVPDFRLVEQASGREVLLEVLGFWRRASVERHLARLREHARRPFLLAVSDQLRVEDTDLEGMPAVVYRFRQMPLPDEVARLAGEVLRQSGT